MQVFMGLGDPFDVPFVLEDYGLILEHEKCEAVMRVNEAEEHGMAEDLESILVLLVRRAFFRYFRGHKRKN